MDSRANARVVTAMVPLANMFGYVSILRSMRIEVDSFADSTGTLSDSIFGAV